MSSSNNPPAPCDGDAEIVRLLRERDSRGLYLLIETYGHRVRGGLRRTFGGSLQDGEIDEALNAASFRAWRRIDSFDAARGSVGAWFFVIARNAVQDILRERKSLGWVTTEQALDDFADRNQAVPADGAGLAPAPAFLAVLRQCIAALPQLQRRVIQADLASGHVADAGLLAKALHTTTNSIYVTRSNARKALRKALQARGCDVTIGVKSMLQGER